MTQTLKNLVLQVDQGTEEDGSGLALPSMRLLQVQIPGGTSPQKTITSVPCPVSLPSHTTALDDISEDPVRILAFLDLPGTSVLRVAGDRDQWVIWEHSRPRASSVIMGMVLCG